MAENISITQPVTETCIKTPAQETQSPDESGEPNRCKIILGVDFGPINTGFCAISTVMLTGECSDNSVTQTKITEVIRRFSSGEDTDEILFWEKISPKNIQIPCSVCINKPPAPTKNKKKPGNPRIVSANWLNSAGEYVCKKHGGITEFKPDLCDRFTYYLDMKILPLKIDIVYPEVQVAARNHVLYYIFKMWCQRYPEINFCPLGSAEKVKWIENPRPASEFANGKGDGITHSGANSRTGKRRAARYKYLKAEMVKLGIKLVPEQWRNFAVVENAKKNDDLFEAYLNAKLGGMKF